MSKPLPSIERLREVLAYDPATGRLTWRVSRGRCAAGSVAGSPDSWGYLQVKVDGRKFQAHRIIWAMQTGEWPSEEIDHEDTFNSNNKWSNLREATRLENSWNRRGCNSLGLKGVSCNGARFSANIIFHGRRIYLGNFTTAAEAHAAYAAKAIELFGEFARAA